MTDEGTETAADATAVEEADNALDTVTDYVEDSLADESETTTVTPAETDESLVFTSAAKPAKRWVLPAVAGAGAVLLASTGALGWQVWQQHQIAKASQEAQRAAVSYAQILTSIDSNKVDENFKDVLDGATGEFKDMYSQSSVELRQLLVENKATAHGVVVDSAVQEASKNKAVVLLFVDQSVTNTKLPDPRIDRSRMKMTLEKVDGRWRASKVELP